MTPVDDLYSLFLKFPRISTDSRNVSRDSLFFAIRGEQFDGNQFAKEALHNGARFAIVDDPAVITNDSYLLVADVITALQQLAFKHRRQTRAKIIGITGSNGKTTTKELIGRVLGTVYNTVVTQGNLNNHLGVPLTLLSISADTDFGVVEMGANHPGEIAALCRIAQPHFGLITNIGKAHLEGFGGFEGVIKAKSELYQYIRESKGHIFINTGNPILSELSEGIDSTGYGAVPDAYCKGNILANDPYLQISWSAGDQTGTIYTNLYGDYNFENILAAVCVGLYFGITPQKINEAIGSYIPENNRSQLIRTERNIIMLDAYNANPSSMKAALEHFSQIEASSKMVILGDMMELGTSGHEEHEKIISLANELGFENLFFIGETFYAVAGMHKDNFFRDSREAESWFLEHPVNGKTILLKGSRKMQLENLRKLF